MMGWSQAISSATSDAGASKSERGSDALTKLNIAFVIKALAAGPGGGAERILATISSELARRGHKVTVLTFDPRGTRDFYRVGSAVRRVRLGVGPTLKSSSAMTTAKRLLRLREALRHERPDVAIGFMHSAFVPLSLALSGTSIPVIGSERTSYDHYRSRPLQRMLLRAAIPLLHTVTVNGEGVRKGYPRPISDRMVVVPNPVLTAAGRADPGRAGRKTLLSVGGLRPEKDHQTLLLAFSQIADRSPEWCLRIVGDGPLFGELSKQISELGLNPRVELAGSSSSVEREYCDAQLFVLPSRYEAFPNCLAEALAHGLPAVGFASCPGTNALIIPGINGELADGPHRLDALSKALEPLMASPSLRKRLGAAAPETVARYSLPLVVDTWEQLLHDVVSAK